MKHRSIATLGLALLAATLLLTQPVPVTDSLPAGLFNQAYAEEDDNVRRTPSMRQSTQRRFSRIRELTENDKLDKAFEVWEQMDPSGLNS